MDLTPYIGWIVFLHVLAAFVFVAGHGVSIFAAFQLRREHDRARMAALLDLSNAGLIVATLALIVLLIAGILAGVVLQSWGRAWIWISLVGLILIGVLMTPLGVGYFNGIRLALGLRTRDLKKDDPDPVPASDADLAALLTSRRPEQLLLFGGVGFLVILWLMRFRPF
jgi:MFS family permease